MNDQFEGLMVRRHDFYLKIKMAYPASGARFY
jgi:hypothetical protein